MKDNETIKALECCCSDDMGCSEDCPLCNTDESCWYLLKKPALDLINRQKAEIARLSKQNGIEFDRAAIATVERHTKHIERRAIKEFADRYERYLLSQLTSASLDKKEWINFCLEYLDNLKKEMVGES